MRIRPLFLLGLTLWISVNATACKTAQQSKLASDPLLGSKPTGERPPNAPVRLDNMSHWYPVDESDIDLHADFAWLSNGVRSHQLGISAKTLEMIRQAKRFIVASYFLFDCVYAPEEPNPRTPEGSAQPEDLVDNMTNLLIEQKRAGVEVFLILDPINRTYSNRLAQQVSRLVAEGVYVLYSDLSSTPQAVARLESLRMDDFKTPLLTGDPTLQFQVNDVEREQLAFLNKVSELHSDGVSHIEVREKFLEPSLAELLDRTLGVMQLHPLGESLMERIEPAELGEKIRSNRALMSLGKPLTVDGMSINLEFVYNILQLKANHRKILVTDGGDDSFEALLGSANPHKASLPSANFAISVRGKPARYIYKVVSEDIRNSAEQAWIRLNATSDSVEEADRFLLPIRRATPNLDLLTTIVEAPLRGERWDKPALEGSKPEVRIVTEQQIKESILDVLKEVQPNDDVRISMFYLSDLQVIEALIAVAQRLNGTLKLILDPNLDAFGKLKDGTPNRQVVAYLRKALAATPEKLEIKWYDTHGEQNHAKILSISNDETGKFLLFTGSANWTGKNLGGANMEANLIVRGSKRLTIKFEQIFELFWTNDDARRAFTVTGGGDGISGTMDYDTPADSGRKWLVGELTGLVAW